MTGVSSPSYLTPAARQPRDSISSSVGRPISRRSYRN